MYFTRDHQTFISYIRYISVVIAITSLNQSSHHILSIVWHWHLKLAEIMVGKRQHINMFWWETDAFSVCCIRRQTMWHGVNWRWQQSRPTAGVHIVFSIILSQELDIFHVYGLFHRYVICTVIVVMQSKQTLPYVSWSTVDYRATRLFYAAFASTCNQTLDHLFLAFHRIALNLLQDSHAEQNFWPNTSSAVMTSFTSQTSIR